jgi:DNA-binding MarR family transcriptional regulator
MFAANKAGQHDALRLVGEIDLSISQLRSLFVLDARDEELAVHELADSIGLSMPSAGRAVDQLLRAGFVTRREDERDRRVKRIMITDAGRDALRRFSDAKRESLRQFAAELTDEERSALSDAIVPVVERLGS